MDKGLGRLEHYDSRNWLLSEVKVPRRVSIARRIVRGLGIRDTRSWRQYRWYDQGAFPACTGYGSATKVAAAPIRPNIDALKALDPMEWYKQNQAEDRAHGRYYSEGATTLAAMEVGKRLGYWSSYYWSYNVDEITKVLHDVDAVIIGSNWYDSMWQRDSEGIARITPNARNVGGHLFCLNGYNPRKGLVRHASSWGDGYYYHTVEDLARLIGEDGECTVMFETIPGGTPS